MYYYNTALYFLSVFMVQIPLSVALRNICFSKAFAGIFSREHPKNHHCARKSMPCVVHSPLQLERAIRMKNERIDQQSSMERIGSYSVF